MSKMNYSRVKKPGSYYTRIEPNSQTYVMSGQSPTVDCNDIPHRTLNFSNFDTVLKDFIKENDYKGFSVSMLKHFEQYLNVKLYRTSKNKVITVSMIKWFVRETIKRRKIIKKI